MGPSPVDEEQLTLSAEVLEKDEDTRLRLIDAFSLGATMEYLQHAPQSTQENILIDNPIRSSLRKVEHILSRSNFNSSTYAQVVSTIEQLESEQQGQDIGPEVVNSIRDNASSWTDIIKQELKQEKVISVDDLGILDADRLFSDPESFFSDPVWIWLEQRPKNDITEACQNLAIGSSTSSVILSLRAVEDCLRRWYEIETGEQLEVSWGGVLDKLMEEFGDENKKKAKIMDRLSDLPPVLSNLYYLKGKRNEVSHPEKSPNIQEAQRTLIIVVSTIMEIYDEIEEEPPDSIDIELPSKYDDNKDLVLKLVSKISAESSDGKVPKEAVYALGKQVGLSSEEVQDAISENLRMGVMYEPASGTLRPI